MKFLSFSQTKLGSSLSLPAHGRAGARATPFLAALFAKRKTKFGGRTPVVERFAFTTGQEARAGKNSFPPPAPPPFARPSENYQNSAAGFSRQKTKIFLNFQIIIDPLKHLRKSQIMFSYIGRSFSIRIMPKNFSRLVIIKSKPTFAAITASLVLGVRKARIRPRILR